MQRKETLSFKDRLSKNNIIIDHQVISIQKNKANDVSEIRTIKLLDIDYVEVPKLSTHGYLTVDALSELLSIIFLPVVVYFVARTRSSFTEYMIDAGPVWIVFVIVKLIMYQRRNILHIVVSGERIVFDLDLKQYGSQENRKQVLKDLAVEIKARKTTLNLELLKNMISVCL